MSVSASYHAARDGITPAKSEAVAGSLMPVWASAMPSRRRTSPCCITAKWSASRRSSAGRALSTHAANREVVPSTVMISTCVSASGQASQSSASVSTPRHMVMLFFAVSLGGRTRRSARLCSVSPARTKPFAWPRSSLPSLSGRKTSSFILTPPSWISAPAPGSGWSRVLHD